MIYRFTDILTLLRNPAVARTEAELSPLGFAYVMRGLPINVTADTDYLQQNIGLLPCHKRLHPTACFTSMRYGMVTCMMSCIRPALSVCDVGDCTPTTLSSAWPADTGAYVQ
jgi:hypothetical protein